ncbi:MAG: hypothetical protein IKQ95_01815 [Synergistaceae bacterium]|nr:hypothetical protein [Synergistaceae bacterium]
MRPNVWSIPMLLQVTRFSLTVSRHPWAAGRQRRRAAQTTTVSIASLTATILCQEWLPDLWISSVMV